MAFSTYGPADGIPKTVPFSRSKKAINPDKMEGQERVKVIHAGAEKMMSSKTPTSKRRASKRFVGK